MPILSQGNLLNKVGHLVALRSKPNLLLVSREELRSLRRAVLNSITVFFVYLFLNRRQSTHKTRRREKKNKAIVFCELEEHAPRL